MTADLLIRESRDLCDRVAGLRFSGQVHTVYNPLDYARESWEAYLRLAASGPRRVVFLGMNPGPWGMAQTGVPFGEVTAVRSWMGIRAVVRQPDVQHPKRPVEGFSCGRSEVSGRRLWGLVADRFDSPDSFFASHFVANYCPLAFMAESGRNITPDKLPATERSELYLACDGYLQRTLEILRPQFAIGVGRFAESRIRAVMGNGASSGVTHPGDGRQAAVVGTILHPSPASPRANKDWAGTVTEQLVRMGAWAPG